MSTAALALRQAFMAVGQPREPQPQSAQERKKMLKRADAVTLLLEKISTQMLSYALARLETQQFMAVGQPRAADGKWTKGGGAKIELSADERRMATYYSSAAYDMINAELREGREMVMGKKAVPILDGAIARSALESDTVFYRGVSFDAKLRLTDKAYMSVTDDPRAAPIFGRDVMEIHAPAGSKALDMRSVSNHNEGEYLLPRGTKLKQIGPKKIVQGVEVTPFAIVSQSGQSFADPQPLDDDVLAMMMVLAELINGAEFEAILDQLESLALDEFDSISTLHGPTTVDPKPIAQLQRDFGSELLTGILRRSAAEVNQIVASGIESGMSRRDIAEMLQARFPVEIMPDWRARLIAQTEVTRAMNNASRNTYARLGRETLQWLDGQPGACPSCSALHGKSVPVNGGIFEDPIRGLQVLHPPLHPGCFLSPRTPVLTDKGYKQISKIEPGEFVLTHKGRFRRVTKNFRAHTSGVEWVKISIGREHRWIVTPEHPLLLESGDWIEAREVSIGDRLMVLAARCAGCGGAFPDYNNGKKHCKATCKSTEERKAVAAIDTREARSVRAKKQWSNPAMRSRMVASSKADMARRRANGWKPSVSQAHAVSRQQLANGTHAFQREDIQRMARQALAKSHRGSSFIERKMGWMLMQLEITAEAQYIWKRCEMVPTGNGTRNRFFVLDFAIPEHKIAIECDGEVWHNSEADAARDAEMELHGWRILRFSEDAIRNRLSECGKVVQAHLANHAGSYSYVGAAVTAVSDGTYNRKHPHYNLEVEEDQSYVVHGLVSHNCRCSTTAFDESAGEEVDLVSPSLAASEAFYDPAQPRDADGKWAGGGGDFKKLDDRTHLIGDLADSSPAAGKLVGVYFGTDNSASINRVLRQGGEHEEGRQMILDEVDALFADAAVALPYGIEAVRGARLDAETAAMLQPGTFIRDKGFTSVTSDDDRAKNFAFNENWGSGGTAVLLNVRVPQGTKVVPYLQEDELMLNRGTAFKVVSAQTEKISIRGEVLKVTLEVVPE